VAVPLALPATTSSLEHGIRWRISAPIDKLHAIQSIRHKPDKLWRERGHGRYLVALGTPIL